MRDTTCGLVYSTNDKSLKECYHLTGLTIFDLSFIYGKLVSLTPCGIVDENGHFTSSNIIVATSLCTGISHATALTRDGLYTWGNGKSGQLGLGVVNRSVGKPTQVEISENFVIISCGAYHTMAVTKAGLVYGWGDNSKNQLGIYSKSKHSTLANKSFLQEDMAFKPKVVPFSLQHKVASVSCGSSYSVLLTFEGHVWTCGSGERGQLGYTSLKTVGIPTRVSIVSESTNELVKFQKIAAGYGHVLALTVSGDIYSWGINTAGQLGLNDNVIRINPSRILFDFKEAVGNVYANGNSSAAISLSGMLFTWGSGKNNRLLHNNNSSKLIPSLTCLGEQPISRFTFGPTSSAVCIESKIVQVRPDCGPAHDKWDRIMIQGLGLWAKGEAVARFEFDPSNHLNFKEENTLSTIIECSAQFLNGDLICCPPPFHQIGRYIVTVSLDGVNYLDQYLSIRVYPRLHLHPPVSSVINVLIEPIASIVVPLVGRFVPILTQSRLPNVGYSLKIQEIEDDAYDTISKLLNHKFIVKLVLSDDPYSKATARKSPTDSTACGDSNFNVNEGRLKLSETLENMYELEFSVNFMDSRITSYIGPRGGCYLSVRASFNGQDFCKPYSVVENAFVFVHNSRLDTRYPDCLLQQCLDLQSKTGETNFISVTSESTFVNMRSKPPLRIHKLSSNIDICLDAIYQFTTRDNKTASIICPIPVSNYLSPKSNVITLCPPSIFEILESCKVQTASYDACKAENNGHGIIEKNRIIYVKVHVDLRIDLPPVPSSYRSIVNILTSNESATDEVISSLPKHLMCITECDMFTSKLYIHVVATIGEGKVVSRSNIVKFTSKSNECSDISTCVDAQNHQELERGGNEAIRKLPKVLAPESKSALPKESIFAEEAFVTLMTPNALEIFPSFVRLSEKSFVHLKGLRYLSSHCRIYFLPSDTRRKRLTTHHNLSRTQDDDWDAMIEMVVEMDDDENINIQNLEYRNCRLKLPKSILGNNRFHTGEVCVHIGGHCSWPTMLRPQLYLFEKLLFPSEVTGIAGTVTSCLLQGFTPPDNLESNISKCIVCLSTSPLSDRTASYLNCSKGGKFESIQMKMEGRVSAIRQSPLKGSKLPGPLVLSLSFTLPTIDLLQEYGFISAARAETKSNERAMTSICFFLCLSIDNGQSFDCSDSPIVQVSL